MPSSLPRSTCSSSTPWARTSRRRDGHQHSSDRGVDGRKFATRRSDVGAIWVRSLTPASHGNAIRDRPGRRGVEALVDSIDPTASSQCDVVDDAGTAKTPMYFGTDRECLKAAVRFSGSDADTAGIVRIKSTLALDRFVVSETYATRSAAQRPAHRGRRATLAFDAAGTSKRSATLGTAGGVMRQCRVCRCSEGSIATAAPHRRQPDAAPALRRLDRRARLAVRPQWRAD